MGKRREKFWRLLTVSLVLFTTIWSSFATIIFAEEKSAAQQIYSDEWQDITYDYSMDEEKETIDWQVMIKRKETKQEIKMGYRLVDWPASLDGLEAVDYPEEYQYEENLFSEKNMEPIASETERVLSFQTKMTEKQAEYTLKLQLEKSSEGDDEKEIIDFFGTNTQPLELKAVRKLVSETQPRKNEQMNQVTTENSSVGTQGALDLTGKTANNPITSSHFEIFIENNWVTYDHTKHNLTSESSLRLSHKFDVGAFMDAPETTQEFKDLVNKAIEEDTPFTFSFSIPFDNRFNIENGKTYSINKPNSDKTYGEFQLIQGAAEEDHRWEVTLNQLAFSENDVKGTMYHQCTVELLNEEKLIVINGNEDAKTEIPISFEKIGYMMKKNVVTVYDYIKESKTRPVHWNITVTPEKDKVLKELTLVEKDITAGSEKGFLFPSMKQLAELASKVSGMEVPFKVVTASGKTLIHGQDYKMNFEEGNYGKPKSTLDITFFIDITEEIHILVPTITKNTHPNKAPLINSVTAKTSNAGTLTTTAEVQVIDHDIQKSGAYIGNGKVQWTLVYHKANIGEEVFQDAITGGIYLENSMKILDEAGEEVTGGWKVNVSEDKKSFVLAFDNTFEAPQRYIITYETKNEEGATKITNSISSNGPSSVGGEGEVEIQDLLITKTAKAQSRITRTVAWDVAFETEKSTKPIVIRDASANDGLHYYYNPEYTLEEELANWNDNKVELAKEYDVDIEKFEDYYTKLKGIVLYYTEGGETHEIPTEELQPLTIKNQVTDGSQDGFTAGGFTSSNKRTWEGERSGFELTLPSKYTGKLIYMKVSTKYGGVKEMKIQNPLDNNWKNGVEIHYNGQIKGATATKYKSSDQQTRYSILKEGKVEGNTVCWNILANTYMHELRAGTTVTEKLNHDTEDNLGTKYMRMTEEQVENVDVYLMKVGKIVFGSAVTIYNNFEKERKLELGSDFEIVPLNDEIGGFTIRLKKDLGTFALAVEFKTDYDLSQADGEETFSLNNFAKESIQGIENKTHAQIDIRNQNKKIVKNPGNFDEDTNRLKWQIALNLDSTKMKNVVVTDEPDKYQLIDLKTVKAYKAMLIQEGKDNYKYVPDYTKELPKELIEELIEYNIRGFKLTFDQETEINYPFVIEYESVLTSESVDSVTNNAHLSWGEEKSEQVSITRIIREGGGSAEGENNSIGIKKVDQNGSVVKEAGFMIERKGSNGIWEKIKLNDSEEHIVDAEGQLILYALRRGEYRIKESTVPKGYDHYEGWAYFDITSDNSQRSEITGDQENKKQEVTDYYEFEASDTHHLVLKVINQREIGTLPSTGGRGNKEYLLCAFVLLTISICTRIYYTSRKRKEAK